MNTTIPIQPTGSPHDLANFIFLFWSLLNMLIPIAIVVLIFWYLKKQNEYRKQLLDKMDNLILLLQTKKADDK
jgi:hypothetical protein